MAGVERYDIFYGMPPGWTCNESPSDGHLTLETNCERTGEEVLLYGQASFVTEKSSKDCGDKKRVL